MQTTAQFITETLEEIYYQDESPLIDETFYDDLFEAQSAAQDDYTPTNWRTYE